MPIYHFVIESDWFTKKGFIESSSTEKAKIEIEKRTDIGENGKIIECNRDTPLNECIKELADTGFALYHDFYKYSVEDITFSSEQSFEEEEGFPYMY